MILISVVIPCHNCEQYLHRAVDSVFNQSFKDWELILVDNNSTDNTKCIIDKYQQEFPDKVKSIAETKKGACAARNKGLGEAKGDWIQFLDADDELLPDKLGKQMNLVEGKSIAFVANPYLMVGYKKDKKFQKIRPLEENDPWIGLIQSRLGITSANLWNKKAVEMVNGWTEDLAASHEYDLMFRIMKKDSNICLDPTINSIIHITSSSLSRVGGEAKIIKLVESRIGLRISILNFLKKNGQLTSERKKAIHLFIYNILIPHYRFAPSYIRSKLKELNLDVPMKNKVHGLYSLFKVDLKRLFD
ncbi:glycosyltransferase family 2 protein [Olivibacter sitiensis]|uniref:glycosyltransferase family 2 protein n=1 Tax=Olivibacter sitiensis TaxID=376470 RepID=UPI000413DDAD|nr:glycosyltransferase family A protein [Olivibacter sitiensis]